MLDANLKPQLKTYWKGHPPIEIVASLDDSAKSQGKKKKKKRRNCGAARRHRVAVERVRSWNAAATPTQAVVLDREPGQDTGSVSPSSAMGHEFTSLRAGGCLQWGGHPLRSTTP